MLAPLMLSLTVALPQTEARGIPIADGTVVPVRVDVNHSTLGFSVRHLGVTRIRGVFNEWAATIMWNEADVARSAVAVVVRTASVDTRHQRRDADLTGADFFDAERHPAIVFRSTRIESSGEGFVAHGDLTVRDITREVSIPFTLLGVQDTPRGRRLFASGAFTIERSAYDLARENGLARALGVVSDQVELEFDIQGVVADPGEARFNSRGKPSIGEEMARVLEQDGVEAALRRYEALSASHAEEYNFSDREVVTLGYQLRAAGRADAAGRVADFLAARSPGAAAHVLAATLAVDRGDGAAALTRLAKALESDALDPTALAMTQLLRAPTP